MSRIGLVLGGGGVSGASYEMATLMAIRLATGWEPNDAEVIVGTSGGAYVGAMVRAGRLHLDSVVRDGEDRDAVADRIRGYLYSNRGAVELRRWIRHGLIGGLRQPGLRMFLGAPARYGSEGLEDWVTDTIGDQGSEWPNRPLVAVAYDIVAGERVAFGTVAAPDVTVPEAVAASSAVPLVFSPAEIDGRLYCDGGVVSGTHADLVLGAEEALDLVIILAPMAVDEEREGAWFHERLFDRVGRQSLEAELDQIMAAWPSTDTLVLRPRPRVLKAMRPNPMDADTVVPTFIHTLASMKDRLAAQEVWSTLERHLGPVNEVT
ncbi:MAG: hypothetical protein GEU79_02555 [Acidimicrobiia bacterium]|nr:hypothetical protein [Acidimicrobiia bacterium]